MLCLGFSLCYVQSSVCLMCRLQSVLCAVFSLSYVQSSVCLMCSLQSRTSSLRSEHASLRSVGKGPRAEIIYIYIYICIYIYIYIYICWVQHQYINAFWVRHQDMSIFQSMSKKIDLAEQNSPTTTPFFLMALVGVFGHFRFGQIMHWMESTGGSRGSTGGSRASTGGSRGTRETELGEPGGAAAWTLTLTRTVRTP